MEAAVGGDFELDGAGFGVVAEELLGEASSGAEVGVDVMEGVVMKEL